MKNKIFKRILAVLTAGAMLVGASASIPAEADGNIISNGTFESGTSGWGVYKESGGAGTITTSDGKLAFNITSLGTVNYAAQLYYDIVPLYQNGVYHMSFDISCSEDRFVEFMIQQNGGTYQAYTWKGLDLTSETLTVDYEFIMEKETDIMTKLCFNCGTQGEELPEHTIYLDNVTLELVDDSAVDYTAFMPYEPDIMTNQVGYTTDAVKTAVFRDVTGETEFSVVNAADNSVVYTGELTGEFVNSTAEETDWYGDFSAVTEPGTYYITCGNLDDSYTFEIADDVYSDIMDETVRMLYLQRCGCEVVDDTFGHPSCHDSMATIFGTSETIDVTGGWHDAGDYGRYIVAAAKAVADLLYAYDANPDVHTDSVGIPESGNGVPDILDEVRYELEWMLKMQASDGGVYHKVTCQNFPGYIMPQKETGTLYVTPVSTTATADFCASMAMAYEFYYDIDQTFAEQCLAAAEKAWAFLEANPNFIFENPELITTGEYGDSSDSDERYWAMAQMYRATGDSKYLDLLNSTSASSGLDWSTVGSYGLIALLTMDDMDTTSAAYTKAVDSIKTQAKTLTKQVSKSGYGIAVNKFNWGSNMTIANSGITLLLAAEITGDTSYITGAENAFHYLLGRNPNGVCYVSGFGTVSPLNPHHRPSMAVGQAMPGMLAGGVNQNLEDSAAKAYLMSSPDAKCYVDHAESYSTNEITIYWNSPFTYLLSLLERDTAVVPPVSTDPTTTTTTTTTETTTATTTLPVMGIVLSDSEIELEAGQRFGIGISKTDGSDYFDGQFVECTSDNPAVAVVQYSDIPYNIYVVGMAEGTANITVYDPAFGSTAMLKVTVTGTADNTIGKDVSIVIDSLPDKLQYNIGEELDLTGGVYRVVNDSTGDNIYGPYGFNTGRVITAAFDSTTAGTYPIYISYNNAIYGYWDVYVFYVTVIDPNSGDVTTTSTTSTTTTTTTTTTETTTGGITEATLVGDVNLDGVISMVDLVYLNKSVSNIITLNAEQTANASCCEDGTINAQDAIALLRFLVLEVKQLPVIPE